MYGGNCDGGGGCSSCEMMERREPTDPDLLICLDSRVLVLLTTVEYGDAGPAFGLAVRATDIVSDSRVDLRVSEYSKLLAGLSSSRCSVNIG